MNTNGTEPNHAPALAATGEAVEPAASTPSETSRITRSRLVSGWHFTRHLLEMVLAMLAGMAVLSVALAALRESPGYANLFVEYGLMGASMAVPMVGWMRFRGHSWRDGGEMTAAMVVPMLAPVALVQLGVAVSGLSEGSLLMLYRFDRYTHGPQGRRA
jgi:hypothetical protein